MYVIGRDVDKEEFVSTQTEEKTSVIKNHIGWFHGDDNRLLKYHLYNVTVKQVCTKVKNNKRNEKTVIRVTVNYDYTDNTAMHLEMQFGPSDRGLAEYPDAWHFIKDGMVFDHTDLYKENELFGFKKPETLTT